MIDKTSLTIIAFIVVFALSAAILAMGTIPEIFKTGEKADTIKLQLNESLILQHEDAAREKQTAHEDAARFNQTLHEDEAREKQNELENIGRDKQRDLIVKQTNKSVNDLGNRLETFINQSTNRSIAGAIERQEILDNILNISNQHQQVAKDHNNLSAHIKKTTDKIDNQTNSIYNMLEKFGKGNRQLGIDNKELLTNLTKEVKLLKEVHLKLLHQHSSLLNSTK